MNLEWAAATTYLVASGVKVVGSVVKVWIQEKGKTNRLEMSLKMLGDDRPTAQSRETEAKPRNKKDSEST